MGDSQSANGPGLFLPTNENVTFIRKKKRNIWGGGGGGGAIAQSVEQANLGGEVVGSIPAAAVCSLLDGSVSV